MKSPSTVVVAHVRAGLVQFINDPQSPTARDRTGYATSRAEINGRILDLSARAICRGCKTLNSNSVGAS